MWEGEDETGREVEEKGRRQVKLETRERARKRKIGNEEKT